MTKTNGKTGKDGPKRLIFSGHIIVEAPKGKIQRVGVWKAVIGGSKKGFDPYSIFKPGGTIKVVITRGKFVGKVEKAKPKIILSVRRGEIQKYRLQARPDRKR